MVQKKAIAVNEKGLRIGESHPKSKLSDDDVDLIRSLREDDGLPYYVIAKKFDTPIRTIRDICGYRVRCQTPARLKDQEDDGEPC